MFELVYGQSSNFCQYFVNFRDWDLILCLDENQSAWLFVCKCTGMFYILRKIFLILYFLRFLLMDFSCVFIVLSVCLYVFHVLTSLKWTESLRCSLGSVCLAGHACLSVYLITFQIRHFLFSMHLVFMEQKLSYYLQSRIWWEFRKKIHVHEHTCISKCNL